MTSDGYVVYICDFQTFRSLVSIRYLYIYVDTIVVAMCQVDVVCDKNGQIDFTAVGVCRVGIVCHNKGSDILYSVDFNLKVESQTLVVQS